MLSFRYKGNQYFGDLSATGAIHFEQKVFESIRAWVSYVEHTFSTRRQTNGAWNRVHFKGTLLVDLKSEYLKLPVEPPQEMNVGPFSEKEVAALKAGLKALGPRWLQIAKDYVKTRDGTQIRGYAHRHFTSPSN